MVELICSILGNVLCVWTFNKKDVELKPSFANILKCLSIFDTIFLVSCREFIENQLWWSVLTASALLIAVFPTWEKFTKSEAHGSDGWCDGWLVLAIQAECRCGDNGDIWQMAQFVIDMEQHYITQHPSTHSMWTLILTLVVAMSYYKHI